MSKATATCSLMPIDNCYIEAPGYGRIVMDNLPDISDSKSAAYSDEAVIGRSFPMKTFSHSENRAISWSMHLFVKTKADIEGNLSIMRKLESLTYPRNTGPGPYAPPMICKIRCGDLLARGEPICVILKSYSVKFPTDVVWDSEKLTPYKMDIDLSFEVVYSSNDLPGAERIVQTGK